MIFWWILSLGGDVGVEEFPAHVRGRFIRWEPVYIR